MSVTIKSKPTTNFADFGPIFPEEVSSEYTGTLLCYIFGTSVVKYGNLTTFQATATLNAMVRWPTRDVLQIKRFLQIKQCCCIYKKNVAADKIKLLQIK